MISTLDHRVEATTGYDIDTLWSRADRGLLDEPHTHLVELHRALTSAGITITFQRGVLNQLSSGEFPVDQSLLKRIDITVAGLKEDLARRELAEARVIAALEPIEAAATRSTRGDGCERLAAVDHAALRGIAGGAVLHPQLLTNQRLVITASRSVIPYEHLERLEASGLVSRDTSDDSPFASQPVTLTENGRSALAGLRPHTTTAPAPAASPPQAGRGLGKRR
ncbi:hypothetical protein PUR57_01515 [Streptomyces sp. JV176]|uniref:hypothetical protein n=1 Tax=Streptomyces sp. JV176 TaxID=858630 RepID=UPI002E7A2B7B|nr:hypothetical protein [Streptomyces sp. JV176]MEE1797378.1 hypothetical protein [Streptomyces sp. JV176]